MIQFYSSEISKETALLEEDEFHHCCKVLRHKVGDEIPISDGKGRKAIAVISIIKKRTAELEVISVSEAIPKATKSILAVAPPKNRARWEWLIEKAVEIGIDEIIPLMTSRTERSKINMDRSNKIIRSAALQSLRDFHPSLAAVISYDKFLKELPESTDIFLAHYTDSNVMLTEANKSQEEGLILIGPEGDFIDSELELARTSGVVEVNISKHRLRTETAAIVSVTMLKTLGY